MTDDRTPPHVIVIYTDDLGYGDVGFIGESDIHTPHLNALAASGATMERWYSNSPVCSPSRAALLTGRHPARAGVNHILGAPRGHHGLPPQETIASRLCDLGYDTRIIGKWHLGTSATSSPAALGFQSFFGFLSGCVDYYSHIMYWGNHNPIHDLWQDDTELWHNGEYLTDLITDTAVHAIEDIDEQPTFLFVSYNAPHYPLHAPTHYVDRHAHLPEDRRMIAAMISAVDDGVGKIVAALEKKGLRENTLVLFSSDNGPSAEERNWLDGQEEVAFSGGSAGGLRGFKGSLFEGGIRMPTLWSWPSQIPSGQRISTACQMSDVAPTILEAVIGFPPDWTSYDFDGTSALPLLRGGVLADRLLLWEYDGQFAASDGQWKLIRNVRERLGTGAVLKEALFNVITDPAESVNVLAEEPGHAQRLGEALDTFVAADQSWRQKIVGQHRANIPVSPS